MTTLPNHNPIINIASMGFQYLVDPTTVPINAAILTNGVDTTIKIAYLETKKYASPSYAKVNDNITYTISFKNIGNTSANDVVVIDTIPTGTTLISDSVYYNNVLIPNGNPTGPNGINLGDIPNGTTSTLQFKVTVNTIPNQNPIINNSTVVFKYTVDPSVPNGRTNGNVSNSTSTQINQAIVDNGYGAGFTKKVSKKYAKVGDTLTYTISLKNTGNTLANDAVLIDTIPSGTSFITDSLVFNGVTIPSVTPDNPGVNLSTLPVGLLSTLSFKVKVDTIPSPNPIINNASIQFKYTVDPSLPFNVIGNGNSNSESTVINQAIIDNGYGAGFIKYSSPYYVKIGDTITYTLLVRNTGNTQATNILIKDTIPNGTTFVNDSVIVNGVTIPGANPSIAGVGIPPLNANSTSTVQFKVTVNTIPTINPIPNNANVTFKFTVDPSTPNDTLSSGNSNTTYNEVNQAIIDNFIGGGLVESVNSPYGKVGDVLTYTVTLKNTGNVDANNIVLSNTIPAAASLIENSILVNGVTTPNINTDGNLAIDLDTIATNSISTVQFSITVTTIPSTNIIQNSSTVFFTYTVNPSDPDGVIGFGNSNIISTKISQAIIDNKNGGGFIKKSDVNYAKPGDTVTYTVTLKNTGNVAANNITFVDTVPNGSSLVPNSIKLNNIVQNDTLPAIKINVGSIASNAISTIQFKVLINNIPSVNPMPNNASVDFTFTVDPSLPDSISYGGNSNTPTVDIRQAIIDNINGNGLTKTVSSSNSTLDDILTYIIGIKNTGNTPANDVILYDTVPDGTSFIPNSVVIDNITVPNAIPSASNGVSIGNINGGSISTVSFKVKIDKIPAINPIPNSASVKFKYTVNPSNPNAFTGYGNSNTTNTKVNIAIIDNTQGSVFSELNSPYFINTKNHIEYTIKLKNTGTIEATDVSILGTIPNGTSFVPTSLKINGSPTTTVTNLPLNIGTLPVGSLTTVTFKLLVNTIPSPNTITHSSSLQYNYVVDPSLPRIIQKASHSNSTFNKVNEAIINNVDGGLNKFVDKRNVRIGDTITYATHAFNIGNVSANNVIFKDTIPAGTIFVPDSVDINGTIIPGYNPSTPNGINLGIIPPQTGVTITFKVTVDSVPSNNSILNSSSVMFKYMLDPSIFNTVMGYGKSNTVESEFKQASIDFLFGGGQVATVSESSVKLNDKVTYTFTLKNTGNIPANNVIFTSTIPDSGVLLANSITLNGDIIPDATILPPYGLNVGTIKPNAVSTVTFDVVVTDIPSLGEINTSSSVIFTQVVEPAEPEGIKSTGNSNIVSTVVKDAIIDSTTGLFTKTVSKNYVKLNDTVTYTFGLKNTGNTTAYDVLLKDTLPNGLSFVSNSMKINGTPINTTSIPSSGIEIGNISAGVTSTVEFKALVSTIPAINPMTNTGYVNFLYTVDASLPKGVQGFGASNSALVSFKQAIIDKDFTNSFLTKTSSKYATTGDDITYTITLKNAGNVIAKNVVLKDTIPTGTSFIPNSVTINGAIQSGVTTSPLLSVPIGDININSTVTVQFKVHADTLPAINPTTNTPFVNFEYTADPSLPNVKSGGISNSITLDIKQAIINNTGFVKSVSKKFADIDDKLTYNLLLENTGNTTAVNVVVFDTIVSEANLIPNSIFINGIPSSNDTINHPAGLFVGTIPAETATLVAFDVNINDIPEINPIENTATVKFNFTVDPSLPFAAESSGNSNSTSTKINRAIINNAGLLTQNVNKEFSTVGDELEYTIVLQNTGTTSALNVIITETFPNGVSFIEGSVYVNENNIPFANPTTSIGINLGEVPVGYASTITFKTKLTNFPPDNKIEVKAKVNYKYKVDPNSNVLSNSSNESNSTLTKINSAIIDHSKGVFEEKVLPQYTTINSIVTYSFNLVNTGNADAFNVRLIDTLPDGIEFINNTVEVNGINLPGVTPESSIGIILNTISVGSGLSVQFKARVTKLPKVNPIPDTAKVKFSYSMDPSLPLAEGSGESSVANLTVKEAIIDNINGGGFVKNTNVNYSTVGKTVSYSLTLTNTGNTDANNLILIDTIPNGFSFVEGSVFINGFNDATANPSPNFGISIPVIPKGGSSNVSFDVTVDTLPSINPVINNATVDFTYTADPSNPNGIIGAGNSNSIETMILLASIDDFPMTSSPEFIKLGDIVTYTISIPNSGNTTADNILLSCTIPSSGKFVENSLYVNSENKPNTTLSSTSPLPMDSIAPGSVSTVSFKVRINSIPDINPIPVSASVSYDFILDPNTGYREAMYGNSVIAYTQLNTAIIDNSIPGSFEKITTPKYAKVDDSISYSIILKNVGNQSANNVAVLDTIPNGLTFKSGSIVVNNINYPTAKIAPPAGLHIGTIAPNETVTITFETSVITTPSPNPVPNSASIKFVYTVDPSSPTPTIGSGNSNASNLTVREAIIEKGRGLTKSVDKEFLSINEIVTYTISLKNMGNTDANNIVLTDAIASGLNYITDSFMLNGINIDAPDVSNIGVNIGRITPGTTATVSFKALVTSIPNPNIAKSATTIRFTYTVNPDYPNSEFKERISNTVSSTINSVDFDYTKGGFTIDTDVESSSINKIITYTAALTNLGNIPAHNVIFTNTVPEGTKFVDYSVKVNDLLDISLNPRNGINLGTIEPSNLVTISFKVQCISIPANGTAIYNEGIINYDYFVNPSSPNPNKGSNISNLVITPISSADISNPTGGFELTSDKEVVLVGDTVTYNVVMQNKGNILAYNIILYSTIPDSVSLIPNSVTVNGITSSDTPKTGIKIGSIAPGKQASISFSLNIENLPEDGVLDADGTVTYEYDEIAPLSLQSNDYNSSLIKANSITKTTQLSNLLKIRVIAINFESFHTGSEDYLDVGDIIEYKVFIENGSNVDAENVIIEDALPPGTSFVPNSFTINNVPISGVNPALPYNIGNLEMSEAIELGLKVVVVSVPPIKTISNTITAKFNYSAEPIVLQPNSLNANFVLPQNIQANNALIGNAEEVFVSNNANINSAYIGGAGFVEYVNKSYVTDGDVLTYTLFIKNIGSVNAQNIIITTTIPEGLQVIPGTLTINGTSYTSISPEIGINLGSLAPDTPTTITYQTKVLNDLKVSEFTKNSNINYGYIVNPSSSMKFTSSSSNIVTSTYKKSKLIIEKSSSAAKANLNNPLTYSITVKNIGNTDAENVFLKDLLDPALSFMSGSILINGVPYSNFDITEGIDLIRIPANSEITISFKALVTSPAAGYLISSAVDANFDFQVDPDDALRSTSTQSKSTNVMALIYLNRTKEIPCNPLCKNTEPCNISCTNIPMCCCSTLRSRVYNVESICTAIECISAASDITKYKMWHQDSVNHKVLINDPRLLKIQTVAAKIEVLRSSIVNTPLSNISNLEGKKLSGKLQSVDYIITFTVTYLNNKGKLIIKRGYKIISNNIILDSEYFDTPMKIKGIIEDISVTGFSNGVLSLSATVLTYLVPTTESELCVLPPLTCISSGIDNINISQDISSFLAPTDSLWNIVNVCSSEVVSCKDYLSLYSTNAKIEILETKKLSEVTSSSIPSNEGFTSTGKLLLVDMMLTVSINFTANTGTQYIKIPCRGYINIPATDLPSDNYPVSTCIENLYVGTIGTTLYASANVVVKATQIREF